MLRLRIKIDTWSKYLLEDWREEIRCNLRDLYCQLPIRRVWLYLKRTRALQLQGGFWMGRKEFDLQGLMRGPEDVIACGMYIFFYKSF